MNRISIENMTLAQIANLLDTIESEIFLRAESATDNAKLATCLRTASIALVGAVTSMIDASDLAEKVRA